MTNPTSNYGFVLPTSTDLVTDLPADFEVALQGVDTRLKALQPGTTLGDIAYSSATANTNTRLPIGTSGQVLAVSGGGVPAWTTTADVTPLTTKGDLFTFTTADARLGVGTDGQTLVADSTASTGLKWATPASAGGMTTISTTNVSGASSFTLDSIPGTYKELLMVWYNFYSSASFGRGTITLNNVTTASKYFVSVAAHASNVPDAPFFRLNNGSLGRLVGSDDTHNSAWQQFGGSSSDTNDAGRGWLRLIDYTNTEYIQFVSNSTGKDVGGTTSYNYGGGRFDTDGSALTRIDVSFGRNVTGTVKLYGVN